MTVPCALVAAFISQRRFFFETWKDVQSFARSAIGADLLPIVRIVDELGTNYLRAIGTRRG
ncbi:hypothetical protein CIC12_20410 [Burkholderia sp. SG-MS1]|nr:hypothetical protein [Paraburkholderia sp. SG-MS1]